MSLDINDLHGCSSSCSVRHCGVFIHCMTAVAFKVCTLFSTSQNYCKLPSTFLDGHKSTTVLVHIHRQLTGKTPTVQICKPGTFTYPEVIWQVSYRTKPGCQILGSVTTVWLTSEQTIACRNWQFAADVSENPVIYNSYKSTNWFCWHENQF